MKNLEGVKNILFDFGGVIIGINKSNAIKRFKEIGVQNIEEYLGEFRQKGIFLDVETGKISRSEFYDAFRELVQDKALTNEDIDSGWLTFLTDIPQYKLDLLESLRKNYNIYLLSNTNPMIMEWAHSSKFSASGKNISDFFDKMFLSYQIGYAKPDKEAFHAVIDGAKLIPSETLFLDDGQSNLDIAAQLGFKTYLANQEEDLRKVFE